jgi:transposase
MSYPQIASFRQRSRWYFQVEKCGKPISEVCTIFGISRKCYYRWHKKDFGLRKYHSKRVQPNLKLNHDVREFIVKEKKRTNYGPLKMKIHIHRELGIDLSTGLIYRFYKRKQLIRKPQKKLSWYEPLKSPLIITKQGEGVQMDVKYVYADGKRKYQFSVLDPYTEQYHFSIFPTKHSINAVYAFKEAQAYFGFKILSVQTDNGSEARGEFHTWLNQQDIPHYFIPKKSPYRNGKVERVHRTIDDEYYLNPYRVWNSPIEWLRYYNFERIHLSLNGLTPHEFYLQKCNP